MLRDLCLAYSFLKLFSTTLITLLFFFTLFYSCRIMLILPGRDDEGRKIFIWKMGMLINYPDLSICKPSFIILTCCLLVVFAIITWTVPEGRGYREALMIWDITIPYPKSRTLTICSTIVQVFCYQNVNSLS